MAENKIFDEFLLSGLPSPEDAKYKPGDKVKVKSGVRFKSYILDSSRQWVFDQGVTDDQNSRIERLSNTQVSKLEGLKTQSEITSDINTGVAQANGVPIPITGTVLPQGSAVPAVVTVKGMANLYGTTGGTTYTQTGGSAITVSQGKFKIGYYDRPTNLWTASTLEYEVPQVQGSETLLDEPIPKGKAVKLYVAPIEKKVNSVTEEGKNRADKSKIIFGSWSTTGVYSYNINRLCILIPVKANTDYIASGLAAVSSASPRLVFFDTAQAFSSYILATGGSENVHFKPSIDGYVGIYMANATDIGSDPTNNIYANRLMVEYGLVASTYEEFKTVLKLPSNLATTEEVDPLIALTETSKNLLDKSKIVAGQYSATGGFTSNINRLAIRFDGLSSIIPYTLSGQGALASNQVAMVIPLKSGGISRVINGDGTTNPKTITLSDLEGPYLLANLANIGNIGVNPTDNVIANAVMLEQGSVATDYESYGLKIPAKNVTGITLDNKYDVYVDFHPTAYQGRERLIIYTRRAQTDFYIGHIINHELDTSEIVYSNQFRITRGNEFKLVNGQMIFVASDVIFGGESECVYWNTNNKADFTGGTHGDEQLIAFNYFIDGVRQDPTVRVELIGCKTAWYTQKSSMHETASSGGIVVPGHPIEAFHYKKTIFTAKGYETHNELEWVKIINFYWYYGICCVGKIGASEAMNEKLVIAPMTGSLNSFFDLTKANAEEQGAANGWTQEYINQRISLPLATTFEYNSPLNKKGVTMKALLFSDYLTLFRSFIHDRANDSKGYFQTVITNSQLNKRDRSSMKITYR